MFKIAPQAVAIKRYLFLFMVFMILIKNSLKPKTIAPKRVSGI